MEPHRWCTGRRWSTGASQRILGGWSSRFRLRWVHGRGHRLFRLESLLNTPLFVGFPGFVSKLWLAHDENRVYRGLYEWDGPDLAEAYVRALWWALIVVSERDSIRH